jgi:alkylation response protein AidB-like acyl-CoA dehydrogenase
MDFDWTPEQTGPPSQARKVATEAVERTAATTTRGSTASRRTSPRRWRQHGWIGMTWPTEFGGGGQPPINRLIVGEELIAAGAPIAAMWFADRQMGPTLIHYGTADQQAEFLPGILSGETTWCIGMSEPDSGSDLASLSPAPCATATTS